MKSPLPLYYGRADQGERARRSARIHDRGQPDVIHRDRVSVQLITGQRQLRKHDHPGLRSTDGLSVHPSVVRNIVRGAGRLHRGDFQWSGHSSEPGAFARS
jgi:hypothetical protein